MAHKVANKQTTKVLKCDRLKSSFCAAVRICDGGPVFTWGLLDFNIDFMLSSNKRARDGVRAQHASGRLLLHNGHFMDMITNF